MPRPGLYSNGNPRPDHLEPAVVEGLDTLIGRDPRTVAIEQLNALGHEKQPLLRVIRLELHRVRGRQRGRGPSL